MSKFNASGMEDELYGSIDIAQKVFGGENTIQKLMDVEAALAKAEATLALIPQEAATEIVKKCNVNYLDEKIYEEKRRTTGHPLMGMLGAYKAACSSGAGEYLHWGATTQDISDTALMLQIKEADAVILKKAIIVRELLKKTARKHKSTMMMGRTNDQHALPITLGFKVATWIDELDRSIERLQQCEKRVFVGQFAGAVGTMASLGADGIKIQKAMMKELGLGCPKISWFATRDRLTELTADFAMLCGALGRMGNEVYNEQRTEVNELAEGFKTGKVGSSTMPHKRNPFIPARLASRGRMAKSFLIDSMQCLENTNERDCRVLTQEPYYIKGICCLTDGALDLAIELFANMEVHETNLANNMNLLNGLVFSEALMMALGKAIGRMEAHEIIYENAMMAISKNQNLKTLLLQDKRTSKYLPKEEIDKIMSAKNYIGLAEHFVDEVVEG